jgi:alpha-L-arabinofuranosidase
MKSFLSILLVICIAFCTKAQRNKEPYSAYLFAYFTGNKKSDEAIRFALSQDGYNYRALNNNNPVILSENISSTGGVRDPHILRGHDGKTFYMVVTDMVSAKGWNSNRAMVLLKSNDLINWTSSVVNIQKRFPGNDSLLRVWAPQTIYDAKARKYMIYFSMKHGKDADKIYYAYANKDFTDLESEPKQLFFHPQNSSCIDGDIIYSNEKYHLFFKTEGSGDGIKKAVSNKVNGPYELREDKYLQQTKEAVEGSGAFKLNNSDEWILMYDVYKKRKYQFTKSKDLSNFKVIDEEVTMNFHPRHGTVISVTAEEADRLSKKWPSDSVNTASRNPVLKGYYADPDILYAEKTKKFYIYPTSDGFDNWSGTYFKCFSSPDMTSWKDEGIILDLEKDVAWAKKNAWAPCIVEEKINGQYKYFYYYTAAQKIGVAVADNPEGPFKDIGNALIDARPEGITRGQVIDPDVFTDPNTGRSYLYWGNGFMAGAELNEDMTSLKEGTLTILKPDATFREGTHVFYRKGLYYFLWSENDTRDVDYRVRYGTADSPLGSISIPANNIVIAKDTTKGIYATGHNSTIQMPGTDEWYIVYHRFAYPDAVKMGRAAGYHREVCIDKMEFNADGSIRQVRPTHDGIVAVAKIPDSVYLFSYATEKNNSHNGLHFAWSSDKKNWHSIGNEFSYLRSDYGRWGSEKKMFTPYLAQGPDGVWHCVWSLNDRDKVFAHAASHDLVDWGRQSYPGTNTGTNVLKPVIKYDEKNKRYVIAYTDAANKYYELTTKDFKTYNTATEVTAAQYPDASTVINLPEGNATGQLHYVPWLVANKLIQTYESEQYKTALHNESAKSDSQRFANLKPLTASLRVDPSKSKPISDKLMGIFFEDINYAADGGLYAELIQNRDFEYTLIDKSYRDKNWTAMHSWSVKGDQLSFTIDSAAPIHANNLHYAVLQTTKPGAALANAGFDGIVVKKGERYNLSLFARKLQGDGKVLVKLVNKKGDVLAQSTLNTTSSNWSKIKTVLAPSADATDALLEIQPLSAGKLALDMISLFPQKTFKGRSNGLRDDLAKVVADLRPRFVRFPGGCVAHGDGLENIYRWKNTIGALETRKPQRNIWNYHQSVGLGYYEYFQFCEDIGAEPLPVLAAGVPCQNSGTGGAGQQGGIPMNEMDEYVQDILDLIEWANGDVNTKWGKLRAAAGHPRPFNLKYIGIGNEDLITDIFEERFTMIFNAIRKKHPEITVIGTVGPFYKGTDYEEGWELANKLKIPMVDEHYYETPGWFVHNQDFYDKYDRTASKVYLGEYASRGNTMYNALAEALYLTALERNGDVVHMTSYAPLLAKEGRTQWNPDLIYFNNTEVKPTVNYEVQRLFGNHVGTEYLPGTMVVSDKQEAVKKRIAFSVVRDAKSKDIIVKLVNVLPVAVSTSVDLSGIAIANNQASKIVLQGNPAEKNARPVQSEFAVAEKFTSELPPYSLTVIRIKAK